MKQLARLADERWAEKPSYLDKPQEQQPGPVMQAADSTYQDGPGHKEERVGVKNAVGSPEEVEEMGKKKKTKTKGEKKKNPWAKEGGGPSEGWQPESWTPGTTKR